MKGYFTQGCAVLLSEPMPQDDLARQLSGYEIAKRSEPGESWEFSGPGLIIAYRPEVNGYVQVDLVDRPWPDHMGDPKNETMLFGAWSMGHFGPFAFPGGLQRAIEQCWSCEESKTLAHQHRAFLRLRLSYVFGMPEDTPIIPPDCDPLDELRFLTGMTLALLKHPSALCYFNPNGELLQSRETLSRTLQHAEEHDLPPLDAWANVRLFRLPDGWAVMDSVGMWQLDTPDHEAGFILERYEPDEVGNFLRNAGLYVLQHGEVIADRDTMGGPGGIGWRARRSESGLLDPPRRTLRWLPEDRSRPPAAFLEDRGQAAEEPKRKPWWKLR